MDKFDELKEGNYIRLNRSQGINRIVEIDDETGGYMLDEDYFDCWGEPSSYIYNYELEDNVENFSPNIKDILKEGDYIDGNLIIKHPNYDGLVVLTLDDNYNTIIVPLDNYDIEGRKIITSDQYKNLGYVIEKTQ